MQAKVKEGKNILYIIRIILAFLVLIECTFLKVFSHYGVLFNTFVQKVGAA